MYYIYLCIYICNNFKSYLFFQLGYQKLLGEQASFTSDMEREAVSRLALVQWFQSVQKIIWPSNDLEVRINLYYIFNDIFIFIYLFLF
jgi:hypothetical protein